MRGNCESVERKKFFENYNRFLTKFNSIFFMDVNFDKSIIDLHLLSFILALFVKNKKSITMLSIKCLNFKFLK